MRSIYKYLLLAIVVSVAGCAPGGKLKEAREYRGQKKFIPAIIMYDDYIKKHRHSAEETIAELERSDCYYELGLQAFTRNRLKLAEDLLFLSNSEKADKVLDDVHIMQAKIAENDNMQDKELYHYDYIADHIPASPLVPKALLARIRIHLDRDQKVSAYNDYKRLWNDHEKSAQADSAIAMINPIIPWFLQNSRYNKEQGNYAVAIAEFQMYADYPSVYVDEIFSEIGESYYLWGLEEKDKNNYLKMVEYFDLAEENDTSMKTVIAETKESVCQSFLIKGDELKEQGKLSQAIIQYERCFEVEKAYPKAEEKIRNTKELQLIYAQSDSLFSQASLKENRKDYQEAKKLYQKAYDLTGNKAMQDNVNRMENFIRAEENPQDFALEIIRDYKQGTILTNVNKVYEDLVLIHGDQVTTTDWKAVYSFGEFKYEVRIDVLSPDTNYYFAWRIHLIDRNIVPLNKASEKMMEK